MIFVMDDSGSIRPTNFERMRQFAIGLTDAFVIGPDRTQVGWINFNGFGTVMFNLSTHGDKESLHAAIESVPFRNGATDISAGLLALHEEGFVEAAGYRPSFDIPEVAIVVTDGQSDIVDTRNASKLLREQRNIDVFAVGVGGGVNDEQLEVVASAGITNDTNRTILHIDSFDDKDLNSLQETIRARTCFSE